MTSWLRALLICLLFATMAHASLPPVPEVEKLYDRMYPAAPRGDLLLNYQVYVAQRSGDVEVLGAVDVDMNELADFKGRMFHIDEGSVLEMVDRSEDGNEVSLALDLEGMAADGVDVSNVPNIIKVRAHDLDLLRIELVDLRQSDNEFGLEEFPLPEIVAGKGGKRSKMTFCLKDVRLFASSRKCRAKVVITEKAANAMALYLGTGGWVRIKRGSWNAYPVCTACFYGGGRQDCNGHTACGHTAIKISATKWKGAGIRNVPGLPDKNGTFKGVKRRPYKFQGCIVPKNRV